MTRLIGGITFLFLCLLSQGVHAEIDFCRLSRALSFECSFVSNTYGYWSEGKVSTGNTNMLENMFISSIDLESRKASLRTDWDVYAVEVLDSSKGLTILNVQSTGNIRFITIYPYYCPERKAFFSVLSEHAGRSGTAAPHQSLGFCRSK